MKRKTILLAGKTLVISLPSKWAKEWGIEKGAELDLTEDGPRIIVQAHSSRDITRASINLQENPERVVRWALSGLHKKGYDEIEIHTTQHHTLIQELIKDLYTGFAIVEQTPQRILLRSVSTDDKTSFEQVLRRAFLVTLNLAEELHTTLSTGKDPHALLTLETTNNQLTNFCQRILNKHGAEKPANTSFAYVIIWNLEKIADKYKYIIEHIGKPTQQTLTYLQQANSLLREYYTLYYNFDLAKLNKLAERSKTLQEDILQHLDKDARTRSHLAEIVEHIRDFNASTAALYH